ncbi:hypothetical protein [Desertibacillus haloalkaliphilus]|uniref:hypothetical protein n=1 Tax=Desertibacillus haloalkaliphilus TaxID=1328930 RepID=UPI001C256BBE|nr:hypothetical protein [Desertibacillus haloalkaliphilus]MBU8908666.1 hypothetical protein [Desertibacillus haloalkaliphilus]
MKKLITILASLIVLIVIGLVTMTFVGSTDGDEDNFEPEPTPEEQEPETDEPTAFDEPTAIEVMQRYKQTFEGLLDDADSSGLLASFDSREEVISYFSEVMSLELAEQLADSYIREDDSDLYIVATESPIWLDPEEEFTIEQVNDGHYRIIQEHQSELIGHVEMAFHARWENNSWKVYDIESTELSEPLTVEETAEVVVDTIAARDFETLANHVDLDKGLLFSPYVYVNEDALVFEQENIATLGSDDTLYLWGYFDGSGEPIEMTASQYVDDILYERDFQQADDILIDEEHQRGNMINNIKEVYPQASVVEYHLEGSEEYAGMDWASLNIVLEQDQNGIWKVVALVNDKWTI